jgi:hypothetical protein
VTDESTSLGDSSQLQRARRLTAAAAADGDYRAAIHAAYIEVAKAKLGRATHATEFFVSTAGAIGTIYSGLLALVYATGDHGQRLPPRAIAPAVFLAAAFFLSIFRMAFVGRASRRFHLLRPARSWRDQERRLAEFIRWVDDGALRRGWAQRCGIVCVGAAVALLPLPFVSLTQRQSLAAIAVATIVVVAYACYEASMSRRADSMEARDGA